MDVYYRQIVDINENEEFQFQPIEWVTVDEQLEEDEPEEYIIRAFGSSKEGYSVCCTIRNFKPYFYIKVPAYWTMSHFKNYVSKLQGIKSNGKNLINYYIKNSLIMKECCIESWVPYYGFCNMENSRFIKMVFINQKGMKGYLYAMKALKEKGSEMYHQVYDANMDTLLKFFHLNSIQPSNHVIISKFYIDDSSKCQINIECDYKKVLPKLENYNNPFLQASYDIETYSKPITENGKERYPFPRPENPDNPVYQIATCFKKVGNSGFMVKCLLTLKDCDPIEEENTIVICCKTEKELITKWVEMISKMDPDIIYSYNGNMFDDNYLWVRAGILGIQRELGKLSRISEYPAKIKEASFSSSAYGTSEYKRLDIPGVINYDILITIRRDFKENSYKLDNISEKYLGEKKNPVSVVEIFKAYESGDPAKIKTILEYCAQDTRLPQLLVDKLHILQGQISMSNVTYVTIKMLIERGQEVKALSQINMTAKKKGFLMPFTSYTEGIPGFVGATVLDPDVGIYNVVTTVDFEGLYPSIIRAHNLCFTSIVLSPEYLNLPGVEYITVQFSPEEAPAIFAQNTETVLPTLLVELYNERKKYKKLMKEAKTEELKAIYDRTQLAVKVSANSIYGVLGSKTLGCRAIAASVTYFGREMIKQTKNYIETHHHSVYPEGHNTNVLDENEEVVVKINDIQKSVKVVELKNIKNCYIKTDAGWRKFTGIEECD
jgi:DNA polymerase delta subunit 1